MNNVVPVCPDWEGDVITSFNCSLVPQELLGNMMANVQNVLQTNDAVDWLYFASALRGGSQESISTVSRLSPALGQFFEGPTPIFGPAQLLYQNPALSTSFHATNWFSGVVASERVDLSITSQILANVTSTFGSVVYQLITIADETTTFNEFSDTVYTNSYGFGNAATHVTVGELYSTTSSCIMAPGQSTTAKVELINHSGSDWNMLSGAMNGNGTVSSFFLRDVSFVFNSPTSYNFLNVSVPDALKPYLQVSPSKQWSDLNILSLQASHINVPTIYDGSWGAYYLNLTLAVSLPSSIRGQVWELDVSLNTQFFDRFPGHNDPSNTYQLRVPAMKIGVPYEAGHQYENRVFRTSGYASNITLSHFIASEFNASGVVTIDSSDVSSLPSSLSSLEQFYSYKASSPLSQIDFSSQFTTTSLSPLFNSTQQITLELSMQLPILPIPQSHMPDLPKYYMLLRLTTPALAYGTHTVSSLSTVSYSDGSKLKTSYNTNEQRVVATGSWFELECTASLVTKSLLDKNIQDHISEDDETILAFNFTLTNVGSGSATRVNITLVIEDSLQILVEYLDANTSYSLSNTSQLANSSVLTVYSSLNLATADEFTTGFYFRFPSLASLNRSANATRTFVYSASCAFLPLSTNSSVTVQQFQTFVAIPLSPTNSTSLTLQATPGAVLGQVNITIQATTTNATYAVYQQQILPYFQKWNLLITTYNSSSVQVALLPICYSVNVTVNFVANQVLSSDVLVAVGESNIVSLENFTIPGHNCSGNGQCSNSATGTCQCDPLWWGDDCSMRKRVDISLVASPQDPPKTVVAGVQFTTGGRVQNIDRRENDLGLWTAESVVISMDISNSSYAPGLEMSILYTNVSSDFGPIPANCSLLGLTINCTLESIPLCHYIDVKSAVYPFPSLMTPFRTYLVIATSLIDYDLPNNNNIVYTVVLVIADLVVVASGPFQGTPGLFMQYNLSISNSGPSDGYPVIFSHTLPLGVLFIPATNITPPTSNCIFANNNDSFSCGFDRLNASQNVMFQFTVFLDPSIQTAPMQATLDLPPYQTDPDYKNSHRVLSPTLIPISDLVIINATAPDSVIAGTSVLFNLSIQNLGPSDAYDTHVQLALLDGLTAGANCIQTGQVALCHGLHFPVNLASPLFVSVEVFFDPSLTGITLLLNLIIISNSMDPDTTNNIANFTIIPIRLVNTSIVIASDDNATAGALFNMPLNVINLGPSSATNVSINLTIPYGTVFVSSDPSIGCQSASSFLISCSAASVRPGTVQFLLVLGVAPDLQDDTLSFFVNFNVSEENLNSLLTDQKTVDLLQLPDLGVVIIAPPYVVPSSPAHLIVSVTNWGPSDAHGTILVNIWFSPGVFSSVQISQSAASCDSPGPYLPCIISSLVSGAIVEFTLDINTTSSDRNLITTATINLANVTSKIYDPFFSNNSISLPDLLLPFSDLSMTLSPTSSVAGAATVLAFSITNLGPSDILSPLILRAGFPSSYATVTSTVLADFNCSMGNGFVDCQLDTDILLVGDTANFSLPLLISPNATGVAIPVNTYVNASIEQDSNPANNEVSVTLQPVGAATLNTLINAPPSVVAGSYFTFFTSVNNSGPSFANSLSLSFTISPFYDISFLNSSLSSCTWAPTSGDISCPLRSLEFEVVTASFTMATQASSRGAHSIAATANAQEGLGADRAQVEVYGLVDLGVSIVVLNTSGHANELASFLISVTNLGSSTAVKANLSILFRVESGGLIAVRWIADTLTCTDDVCLVPDYKTDEQSSFVLTAELPATSVSYNLTLDLRIITSDVDLDETDNSANASVLALGCPPHFYGPTCNIFCDDIITCHAKGTCNSDGTCDCTIGFCGAGCNVSTSFLVSQVSAGDTTVTITNSSVFTAAKIRIGKSNDCLTAAQGEVATVVGVKLLEPSANASSDGRHTRSAAGDTTTIILVLSIPLATSHAPGEIITSEKAKNSTKFHSYFLAILVIPLGLIAAFTFFVVRRNQKRKQENPEDPTKPLTSIPSSSPESPLMRRVKYLFSRKNGRVTGVEMETRTSDDSSSLEGGGFTRRKLGPRDGDGDANVLSDEEGGKGGADVGTNFKRRPKPNRTDSESAMDLLPSLLDSMGTQKGKSGDAMDGGGFQRRRRAHGEPDDEMAQNGSPTSGGGFQRRRGLPSDSESRNDMSQNGNQITGGGFRRRGLPDDSESSDPMTRGGARHGKDDSGGAMMDGGRRKGRRGDEEVGNDFTGRKDKSIPVADDEGYNMTNGGVRRGGRRGEGEGRGEGGGGQDKGGHGNPMMDGGSRRGKGKGDDGVLMDGGRISKRQAELDPRDPNYQIHHKRFVLENTIKQFIQDHAMIMNDVDFVHLRAGKCTLNGKRINVRMNDVGKLQVGDWQLEDFIKEYGKKKQTESTASNQVVGGATPGMLSGGVEESESSLPHPLPKAPPRLAALPAIGTQQTVSGSSPSATLPPVNLPILPRQKLAPLPKININTNNK